MTPYQVVFGQTMITHGNDCKILRRLELLAEQATAIERNDKFALLRESMQARMKKAYDKNARTYDLRTRRRDVEPGKLVYRKNFAQSSLVNNFNSKLAPTGVKAEVLRKRGNVYYELRDIDTGKTSVYHLKDIWI